MPIIEMSFSLYIVYLDRNRLIYIQAVQCFQGVKIFAQNMIIFIKIELIF